MAASDSKPLALSIIAGRPALPNCMNTTEYRECSKASFAELSRTLCETAHILTLEKSLVCRPPGGETQEVCYYVQSHQRACGTGLVPGGCAAHGRSETAREHPVGACLAERTNHPRGVARAAPAPRRARPRRHALPRRASGDSATPCHRASTRCRRGGRDRSGPSSRGHRSARPVVGTTAPYGRDVDRRHAPARHTRWHRRER